MRARVRVRVGVRGRVGVRLQQQREPLPVVEHVRFAVDGARLVSARVRARVRTSKGVDTLLGPVLEFDLGLGVAA